MAGLVPGPAGESWWVVGYIDSHEIDSLVSLWVSELRVTNAWTGLSSRNVTEGTCDAGDPCSLASLTLMPVGV